MNVLQMSKGRHGRSLDASLAFIFILIFAVLQPQAQTQSTDRPTTELPSDGTTNEQKNGSTHVTDPSTTPSTGGSPTVVTENDSTTAKPDEGMGWDKIMVICIAIIVLLIVVYNVLSFWNSRKKPNVEEVDIDLEREISEDLDSVTRENPGDAHADDPISVDGASDPPTNPEPPKVNVSGQHNIIINPGQHDVSVSCTRSRTEGGGSLDRGTDVTTTRVKVSGQTSNVPSKTFTDIGIQCKIDADEASSAWHIEGSTVPVGLDSTVCEQQEAPQSKLMEPGARTSPDEFTVSISGDTTSGTSASNPNTNPGPSKKPATEIPTVNVCGNNIPQDVHYLMNGGYITVTQRARERTFPDNICAII